MLAITNVPASVLPAGRLVGDAERVQRVAGAAGPAGTGRVAAAGHVRRGAHDALTLPACVHAVSGRSSVTSREGTFGSWQLKRR